MSGYGQIYESMYSGSMMGSGATVFAVWPYVIAKTNPRNCIVELNPRLLAFIIGETEESILKAIDLLCAPDPKSRTKTENGRRLIKRGEFDYFVVNFRHYRDLLRKQQHAEYMAAKMAQKREAAKLVEVVNISKQSADTLNSPAAVVASASVRSPEGVQGEDAADLPMVAGVLPLLNIAMERFQLPPMDATINTIRANIAELLGRGYKPDQIESVLRWATSDKARHLKGRPQSAVTATDPFAFSTRLQTMQNHAAEIEHESKKRNR